MHAKGAKSAGLAHTLLSLPEEDSLPGSVQSLSRVGNTEQKFAFEIPTSLITT